MTKLTKAVKEQIIKNAVNKSGLIDEHNKIIQRRAEWANDVRLFAIGGIDEEKKLIAINEQYLIARGLVPDNLKGDMRKPAKTRNELYVNVAGLSFCAYFHGGLDYNKCEQVCRISPSSVTLLADNPLVAEFHEIHNQQEDYENKVVTLRDSVNGVIANVTTVKKLLDVWPEAKELLPPEIEKQTVQLSMVQTADLNKMIRLPS
ncbi:hypothetical protein D3C77_28720 [compost metagenome]